MRAAGAPSAAQAPGPAASAGPPPAAPHPADRSAADAPAAKRARPSPPPAIDVAVPAAPAPAGGVPSTPSNPPLPAGPAPQTPVGGLPLGAALQAPAATPDEPPLPPGPAPPTPVLSDGAPPPLPPGPAPPTPVLGRDRSGSFDGAPPPLPPGPAPPTPVRQRSGSFDGAPPPLPPGPAPPTPVRERSGSIDGPPLPPGPAPPTPVRGPPPETPDDPQPKRPRSSPGPAPAPAPAPEQPPPPRRRRPRWGTRDVNAFDIEEQVGEGTYGQVYRATDPDTGDAVALKKIRMDAKEGFPITALREVKILQSLQHPNIVGLKEVVTSAPGQGREMGEVFMVFEYLDHDLCGLLNTPGLKLSLLHIKTYVKQLLEGCAYMHRNKIMHRDIKSSNLLIGNSGELKIGDWGLARPWSEQYGRLTNPVITLWYRPPELLLNAKRYTDKVDMWSIGCLLAELLSGRSPLPGNSELDQLYRIFSLCGHPRAGSELTRLPMWSRVRPPAGQEKRSQLLSRFAAFPPSSVDLVSRLLALNPSERLSASDALNHQFFWEEPLPVDAASLPPLNVEDSHEYQTKQRRKASKRRRGGRRGGRGARRGGGGGRGSGSGAPSAAPAPAPAGGGAPAAAPAPAAAAP